MILFLKLHLVMFGFSLINHINSIESFTYSRPSMRHIIFAVTLVILLLQIVPHVPLTNNSTSPSVGIRGDKYPYTSRTSVILRGYSVIYAC